MSAFWSMFWFKPFRNFLRKFRIFRNFDQWSEILSMSDGRPLSQGVCPSLLPSYLSCCDPLTIISPFSFSTLTSCHPTFPSLIPYLQPFFSSFILPSLLWSLTYSHFFFFHPTFPSLIPYLQPFFLLSSYLPFSDHLTLYHFFFSSWV